MNFFKTVSVLSLLYIIFNMNVYAQKINSFDSEKARIELIAQSSNALSKTIQELDVLIKKTFENKPSSEKQAILANEKIDILERFKTKFRDESDASTVLLSSFQLALNTQKDYDRSFVAYGLGEICRNMPGFELFNSRFINNEKEMKAYSEININYAKNLPPNEFNLIKTGLEQQIKLARLSNALCKRITDESNWR